MSNTCITCSILYSQNLIRNQQVKTAPIYMFDSNNKILRIKQCEHYTWDMVDVVSEFNLQP